MQALKTIGREAFGLFVADARFTLALIGWIAIVGAIPVLLEHLPYAGPLLLFVGFALILLENLGHVVASASSQSGPE
jgi:hypothetical protein